MHYYQFNIADYRKDTAHLTPVEHYIYRTLIDWYYLDECPIPKETQSVMRRLRLVTEDEARSLKNVLTDFFIETETGWEHQRIEFEIAEYYQKCQKNKENGKKGGRPKSIPEPKKTQSVNFANPNQSELNPNHKPLTKNHKPETINQEPIPPLPPQGDCPPTPHRGSCVLPDVGSNDPPSVSPFAGSAAEPEKNKKNVHESRPNSDIDSKNPSNESQKTDSVVVIKNIRNLNTTLDSGKSIPEKPRNRGSPETLTGETWEAYAKAYFNRYGADPVRNATVNGQLAQFVKRVARDEAPHIAAFYLTHNAQFYVKSLHPVKSLLADAEKLRTEWATNRRITDTRAKQIDEIQSNRDVAEIVKEEWRKRGKI